MKVLVLWADDRSANLGVRVLGAGTEAMVRRIDPEARVDFYDRFERDGPAPGPLNWVGMASGFLTGRAPIGRWLASYDLVVDTGSGDSFADIYGLRRHAVMSSARAVVAKRSGALVMGPQTVGPFLSARGRAMARASLRGAAFVATREPRSSGYAEALFGRAPLESTDVVFALPQPPAAERSGAIVNVSGLLWNANPHVDFEAYRATTVRVVRGLASAGHSVRLLAHVLDNPTADNDVPACEDIARQVPDVVDAVIVPRDLGEARREISTASVLVGARMHACLNALSVGVPAVPLAYSRKFAPLMESIGWPTAVDLKDPDAGEQALSAALELVDQHDRTTAVRALADRRLRRFEAALIGVTK